MIHRTYVLTLHSPEDSDMKVIIRPEFLRETEENLTDMMPAGFWVTIEDIEDVFAKEEALHRE